MTCFWKSTLRAALHVACLLALGWGAASCARTKTPEVEPEIRTFEYDSGFQNNMFTALDTALNKAVAEGRVPGAVLSVARDGKIVYERAAGWRDLTTDPPLPMMRDTLFDVASLTKPLATAPAAGILSCRGELADTTTLDTVTLNEALHHDTFLPVYIDWHDLEAVRQYSSLTQSVQNYFDRNPHPRRRTRYSNVAYVLIGALVEETSGSNLEAFDRANLWGPLGMTNTTYEPNKMKDVTIARTSKTVLPGRPFDPLADYILLTFGHCPGHSGLFSTAGDINRFSQAILHPELFPDMPEMTCLSKFMMDDPSIRFPQSDDPESGAIFLYAHRTRGFAIDDAGRNHLSHTGYTGTYLGLNRETGVSVVLLTNAVHSSQSDWDSLRVELLHILERMTEEESIEQPETPAPPLGDGTSASEEGIEFVEEEQTPDDTQEKKKPMRKLRMIRPGD